MSSEPFTLCVVKKLLPPYICDALAKMGDTCRQAGTLDVWGHQSWNMKLETFCRLGGHGILAPLKKLVTNPPDIGIDNMTYECGFYARLEHGGRHTLHADSVKLDGTPNHTPHRIAAMIIYLRDYDSSYRGGELVFPYIGQTVIPEQGLMVCFPATLAYQHEVMPVLRGVRDSITVFYKEGCYTDPDINRQLRQQIKDMAEPTTAPVVKKK